MKVSSLCLALAAGLVLTGLAGAGCAQRTSSLAAEETEIAAEGATLTFSDSQTELMGSGKSTAEVKMDTYTVAKGDTLWKISQKIYGNGKNWAKIYEINRGSISDPDNLVAGTQLMIPKP